MKIRYIHIVFCFLLIFNIKGYAQTQVNHSIKMDILLDSIMLKEASVNVKFTNTIDYTPTGFLLLASPKQFYMLGMGSMPPVFNKTMTEIDAFAVTQDDALLIVSGDKLCSIDSLGNLLTLYNLPISKAGIVSGNDDNIAYIYDRILKKGKKEYVIYRSSDKQCTRLASVPTPILSVFEYKTSLFFSTGNKILCTDNKTKTFFDFFSLQQKQNIISITGDSINQALYFSTQDTVYRVKNGKFEYICTELGGVLKYDGEGLLIYNPEKSLIVRLRNELLYPQEIDEKHILKINKENYLSDDRLKGLSIQDIRNLVIQKRIGEAVKGYSYLVAKDSLNTNLLTEYSYALALSGTYDCALMNLDRVRLVSPKSEEVDFYSGLVFSLMGYDDLFEEYIKNIPNSKLSTWISFKIHSDLLSVFQQSPKLNMDDFPTSLKRVNYLAASGLHLQSIALYEEIIKETPAEYLPHVGYSIVLEKVGLYQKAIKELDIAIQLMGNSPTELESKNVYQEKKRKLEEKLNTPNSLRNKWITYKNNFNPKTMLYVGGMVTNSTVSLDSRFGLYLSNSFNGAADLGLSGDSENFYINLGLSGYQRFGIFVWGEGLSLQLGNSTVLNLKTSLGLSFINRNGNSSWDIFLDWYLPINQDLKSTYGISIGKSIYFGKRK